MTQPDSTGVADTGKFRLMIGETPPVAFGGLAALDENFPACFHVAHQEVPVAAPFDFGRIEDLHHDQVIAARSENPNFLLEAVEVPEKIRGEDDKTAVGYETANLRDGPAQIGGMPGFSPVQNAKKMPEMTGADPRREEIMDRVIETTRSYRITLAQEKISNRPQKHPRVIQFVVFSRGESHGPALVEKKISPDVRFLAELLDVVAVGSRVELPVQIAGVLSGNVGAVLGELGREAVVGTAVETEKKSFDDDLDLKLKRFELHECRGVEPAAFVVTVLNHGTSQSEKSEVIGIG